MTTRKHCSSTHTLPGTQYQNNKASGAAGQQQETEERVCFLQQEVINLTNGHQRLERGMDESVGRSRGEQGKVHAKMMGYCRGEDVGVGSERKDKYTEQIINDRRVPGK